MDGETSVGFHRSIITLLRIHREGCAVREDEGLGENAKTRRMEYLDGETPASGE